MSPIHTITSARTAFSRVDGDGVEIGGRGVQGG